MEISGSPSSPNKWLECFESWDILIRWVNPPLAHLARFHQLKVEMLEKKDGSWCGSVGLEAKALRNPWCTTVISLFWFCWPDLFLGLVREPLDYDALVLLVDSCRRMNMQKMRKKLGFSVLRDVALGFVWTTLPYSSSNFWEKQKEHPSRQFKVTQPWVDIDPWFGPKPPFCYRQASFTDADVEKFRRLFQSLDKEARYEGSEMQHCTEDC